MSALILKGSVLGKNSPNRKQPEPTTRRAAGGDSPWFALGKSIVEVSHRVGCNLLSKAVGGKAGFVVAVFWRGCFFQRFSMMFILFLEFKGCVEMGWDFSIVDVWVLCVGDLLVFFGFFECLC